jgi:hypothetical protein
LSKCSREDVYKRSYWNPTIIERSWVIASAAVRIYTRGVTGTHPIVVGYWHRKKLGHRFRQESVS